MADDDDDVTLTAAAQSLLSHPTSGSHPGRTYSARPKSFAGRAQDAVAGTFQRSGPSSRKYSKVAGAKNDATSELMDAGVLGGKMSRNSWIMVMFLTVALVAVSATYTGFVIHQKHKISSLVSKVSLPQLSLRDPETGLICAQCDTSTGDIVVSAGTVFLGDDGASIMPTDYADSCMSCGEDVDGQYGLDLHNSIPFVQDDFVPVDVDGATVYTYGHTMRTATGVAEDGGLPRSPYSLQTTLLDVRSGSMHFSRFGMGQTCGGSTCPTSYEALTDTPTSGTTTGFPDLCSGTTTSIPENSMYFVHRDMDENVEFVGGFATLGDTTNGQDMTFVHLCACIVDPVSTLRAQYCTQPFIGAYGGDYANPGTPLVS